MTFMESQLASELNLLSNQEETVELSWLDDTVTKRRRRAGSKVKSHLVKSKN